MENKIVRECVQGLINDSKIVDKLCDSLDCHRTEILEKVETNSNSKSNIDLTWFNEKMIEIGRSLESATNAMQDARCNADNAKYEAGYADDNCMEGEGYIDDAKNTFRDIQAELEKVSSNEEIEDATQNEETVTTN
tara:strand:+ start:1523 stop:1930 length:408 start_codon:yes stop_codon:yes gene_type:complete